MDNKDLNKYEVFGVSYYNRPYVCNSCGGLMIFKGVGEYQCEECYDLDYDDYGKARNYIETHPGATSAQIAENTDVSQKSIRNMLKEGRLEVAADSKTFLKCEICQTSIRYGRFCDKCESSYHRSMEAQHRKKNSVSGFGMEKDRVQKGEKRFNRKH